MRLVGKNFPKKDEEGSLKLVADEGGLLPALLAPLTTERQKCIQGKNADLCKPGNDIQQSNQHSS